MQFINSFNKIHLWDDLGRSISSAFIFYEENEKVLIN